MTRTGKIARLPLATRNRLNQQLADGVPGVKLVAWLNALPEVVKVLTEQFDGRPINEPNLSEWKAGGWLDWQARQETLGCARNLAEEAAELKAATGGSLAAHLSVVLAGRYARLLSGWDGEMDEAFQKKLRGLRLLCQDMATLRRGDLRAERLALEKNQFDNAIRCDQTKALQLSLDECKGHPEVEDAFRKAIALLAALEGPTRERNHVERERKRFGMRPMHE